ncbi:hypothetical protein P170DRAFT_488631 [Aspergillus steynii IBT 23096]|uniref:Zn(2)-C6 fungal-type domain-containing protein n=1 Tax=Aspergillus steynii IBT 23096 TaxID=1392250 RepID=A0A2I2GH36_9EURO|nr:uncharacterized protein P170DRAFT_488631 [Aspergillus steynii IBT 23096]PLB52147.1 hypothetical protein P170DRAFT_488631 [Aspergillus steynii IBT 23096]
MGGTTTTKASQASGYRRPTRYAKSGCRTCKIRHIKCDEEKPACRKCTNSGRVCDGYGRTGRPRYLLISRNPGPFPGVAPEERSSLDYFRYAPALKLTGLFKSEFWDSLVLQTCFAESSVLHAIVALAAAHRSRFSPWGNEKAASAKSYDSFALIQYNKAIKSLTTHVTAADIESVRIAIISSIVFVCLDMLRGEYNSMNMHFQHGIRLLNLLQSSGKGLRQARHIFVQQNPQSTDEHLIHAFARLHLQFMMLGSGLFDDDALFTPAFVYGHQQISVPRIFSIVQEARRSLDQILSSVIQLALKFAADHISSAAYLPPLSPTLLKQQEALKLTLQDWIEAFDSPLSLGTAQTSRYGELALRVLRIHWTMATILLSTCFATKETAFDSHTSAFESIINQIEALGAVVANTPQHIGPTKANNNFCQIGASFSIDLGCYAPLYFTALKCRVPHIRRHAISILQQCKHTEGVWTGPVLARLATCVVDTEERDFSTALYSDSQENKPSFTLPEYSRFYCVRCVLPKESRDAKPKKRTVGTLICHRFCHELGKDGGWVSKSYDIDFNP